METSTKRPRIVCLVGSSRFKAEFCRVGELLEKQGVLVLAMTFFQHADGVPVSASERETLETVDRLRIDLADEVLVIDAPAIVCPACGEVYPAGTDPDIWSCHARKKSEPGLCSTRFNAVAPVPYVGESTRREIAYAESLGKPVRYLSKEGR